MKDDIIKIRREDWDYLRSFKRAPIYKKNLEKVRLRELIEKNKQEYETLYEHIRR